MAEVHELLRRGRHAEAERLCLEAAAAQPGEPTWPTLLSLAQLLGGAPERAQATLEHLTLLQPQEAAHWNNLGLARRQLGHREAAASAFRRALELEPQHADAAHNLGELAAAAGDLPAAQQHFLRALRAAPGRVESRLQAALCSFECGDNPLTEELLADWRRWPPLPADAQLDLAWLLGHLGQGREAEAILRHAIAHLPQPLRAQARLATLLERANRLDEARAVLADMPAPDGIDDAELRAEALGAQATLALREADPAATRTLLQGLLDTAPHDTARVATLFHLARLADRGGEQAEAMALLESAHALQQAQAAALMPDLAREDAPPLRRAARRVDAAAVAHWPHTEGPPAAQSPIFVVGFPRSGTTLLEAMLDSHPQLAAMDERPFLQDLIDSMERAGHAYPADLGRLDDRALDNLRRVYWQRVAATGRWRPGQRLVDKNPLNFLCLPLLRRLFPHSPLVLALRHPCDVLLSCYQQHFRSPAFALMCASLPRLAEAYATAMDFWIDQSALLRPRALELRYEDLIADFPARTAQLADFLGLDDVAAMQRYHEHARGKGYISTPSYSAVVRPPEATRIARWRRYAEWFEPVLPRLRPFAERWGYSL